MNALKEKRPKVVETIPTRLIRTVCARLRENKRVRRSMPVWGRIHIDRQLPFLCIYCQQVKPDATATERLVTSEASYLLCSGQRRLQPEITELVRSVSETLVEQFGACLLLELWSAVPIVTEGPVTTDDLNPRYRLVAAKGASSDAVTGELEEALARLKLGGKQANVVRATSAKCCPKGQVPILPSAVAAEMGCVVYGLEIAPIYCDTENDGDPARKAMIVRSSGLDGAPSAGASIRFLPNSANPSAARSSGPFRTRSTISSKWRLSLSPSLASTTVSRGARLTVAPSSMRMSWAPRRLDTKWRSS